ncbi:MAG: hypothetical protein ACFFC1_15005, partial [Promethearchaeota archaeon]
MNEKELEIFLKRELVEFLNYLDDWQIGFCETPEEAVEAQEVEEAPEEAGEKAEAEPAAEEEVVLEEPAEEAPEEKEELAEALEAVEETQEAPTEEPKEKVK